MLVLVKIYTRVFINNSTRRNHRKVVVHEQSKETHEDIHICVFGVEERKI